MEETLGFVPKVDFNAGVVAAGEAQIESTVMGNASPLVTADPKLALADRGQVCMHMHTHICTHAHAYAHARASWPRAGLHAHAHTHMHACACICTCTR